MYKILVIEDDELVRENIIELLRIENFQAIGAENGRIGVQIAKEQMPDLILCDIVMPEVDGYSVRNILCQTSATATIPFIFISAKAEKADVRLGMTLGADDYLTKPFTADELLEAIFTRLDKKVGFDKFAQEKLNELCGSISAALPTELLIPLHQVKEFLRTLTSEYGLLEKEKILEMTKESYISSLRLQKLVQNFLFYTLLEATTTNPDYVKVLRNTCTSMAKSVVASVAIEKAEAVERKADLHLELQDAAIGILEANLAKIVEEVAENAFKFSTAGTPVSVKSLVVDGMFLLCITNYGPGLTAAQIAKIGPYMHFESNLQKQEGSGLGLAIAKRLSQLYAGELTIESTPGEQTVVRIALPIKIT